MRNARWYPLVNAAAVASPPPIRPRCAWPKGRQDSQAQSAAHLRGGVDETGGQARVTLRGARHRQRHQRGESGAAAEAEQDHHRQDVTDVAAVRRRLSEKGEGGAYEHQTGDQRRPGAEVHDQPLGVAHGQRPHHDRHGQEREADLQGP